MVVKDFYGNKKFVSLKKYLIKWDKVVSGPQKKVKDAVNPYWFAHQVCEEFPIPGTITRVDLINFTTKTVVEISPKSSHKYNKFFHKNRAGFLNAVKRDVSKPAWCHINGYTFIEIDDIDLKSNESILKKIFESDPLDDI